jgi:subtilisin-like proprotein convertase family protein
MPRILVGTAALLAILGAGSLAEAAGRGEAGKVEPVRVELRDRLADLKLFEGLDLDVDGVFGEWARLYVLPEEAEKLEAMGYALSSLDPGHEGVGDVGGTRLPGVVPSTYHTYETLTAELQQIAADHPAIVRLYSIGTSVQGRTLWMVKVTRNPDLEEDEPEVRYIAAMHGDEVVGKEMCVNLLNLLTDSYGSDPRITALVDTTEIWLLPSMNPDGTAMTQRYNAGGIDLNRNFPDQFVDASDTTTGRATETARVMEWGWAHATNLSANFHGGALVANYPFDGTATAESIYSLAPDDAMLRSVSRSYADANGPLSLSNSDPSWDRGICNGADWYHVTGGMQDWNYVWRGDHEITLEISNIKWPSGSTLPQFWEDNRESMLRFFERAQEGVRGRIRNATTGAPLKAAVRVSGFNVSGSSTWSDPDLGDYHKLLLPGRYDLEVSATGYASAYLRDVVVPGGPAVRRDVFLQPLATNLQPTAYQVRDLADGELSPGEGSDFQVTLKNFGQGASGITGVLQAVGFDAVVDRASTGYPSMPGGGSGSSLSPYHHVIAAAGAPSGRKAGFVVRWTSSTSSGTTEPVWVPLGAATCTTVASSDVPRAVGDHQTVESTLAFPSDLEISSIDVYVDLLHTYIGDVHVSVRSPSGTPVALHSRSGGSSDNILGWYDDTLFPAEALHRVRGEHAAGTWRLRVEDGVPSNTGNLRNWSVKVCGRPFDPGTPEIRLRDFAKAGTDMAMTWWAPPGLTSYKVYRSTSPVVRGDFVEVTAGDPDPTDARFAEPLDEGVEGIEYYLVTGVGPNGEGPR